MASVAPVPRRPRDDGASGDGPHESAGQRFIPQPVRVARAYEELASLIRERIISGDLKEGDRVPSETALAGEARVSRSTVREALRTLEEAGFIERSSPKIMVVRRDADKPAYRELTRAMRRHDLTFHHLHEALIVLEPELTRLATIRADSADIAALEANLKAQSANLSRFQEWSRLDEEFHLTIAEMSANPALIIARTPITQLLLPTLNQFMSSDAMTTRALQYHERILEEIRSGDGEAAAMMTKKHVNDFRVAWEKAGLDFHLQIGQLADEGPSAKPVA